MTPPPSDNSENSPSVSKARLRKLARTTLGRLSKEDHARQSALLIHRLAEHLKSDFPHARRIATFSAMPHEPDLSLLQQLLPERQFHYPLILNEEEMSFHLVTDSTSLVLGPYKIQEPNPQAHPPVNAEDLDLILVPGLAFDIRGNRLGQGKGYYDRFLQSIPTTPTVGITYSSQLLPEIPCDLHDQAVALLATERGVVTT